MKITKISAPQWQVGTATYNTYETACRAALCEDIRSIAEIGGLSRCEVDSVVNAIDGNPRAFLATLNEWHQVLTKETYK